MVYVNTSVEKQDGQTQSKSQERSLLWDEENRLDAIYTNGFIAGYWYDASGERVVKSSGDDEGIYVNDVFSGGRTETANFTTYINPYIVISKGGQYTKHIYIGSQRIVSKLGDLDSYGQDPRRIEYAGAGISSIVVDYADKYKTSQQTIKDRYAHFEVSYFGKDNDDYVNGGSFARTAKIQSRSFLPDGNDNPELYQYYYHSDHLGSSSLITNLDGEIVQHIEYVPFGEVFIEERNNTWNTPYLFNAKELDEEAGLYYYGARYYDSRLSIWLSTDPLQENYPNISTYAYSALNPVKYVDPDGRAPKDWDPGLGIWISVSRRQSGFTHDAPQKHFGYGDIYDDNMGYLFDIQATKFQLEGGVCLRLWKGNYAMLADEIAPERIKSMYGGVGGEIGLYNSNNKLKINKSFDFRGVHYDIDKLAGQDLDAVMTKGELDNMGLKWTSITVHDKSTKRMLGYRIQSNLSFWTTVFSWFEKGGANEVYTINLFSFKDKASATSFYNKLNNALEKANDYKHNQGESLEINQNGKIVSITWGIKTK